MIHLAGDEYAFYMMADAPQRTFPRNATEFARAMEELFKMKVQVMVLEYDVNDETYLVAWSDRNGLPKQSWVTQTAMSDLMKHVTLN